MLEQLSPFIGEWDLEVSLPSPDEVTARATFEWALDGRFLLQRTEVSLPEAPNTLSIIGPDPGVALRAALLRHARRRPRLRDDVRGRRLDAGARGAGLLGARFWQRYEGSFSADGGTIDGAWHISHDAGATWEKDFDLVYRRVG